MIEKINLKPVEGNKSKVLEYKDTVLSIFDNHITVKQDYTCETDELEEGSLSKIIEVKNMFTIPKQHVQTLWLNYDDRLDIWSITIETANHAKDLGVENFELGKEIYDKLYKWLYSNS